MSDFYNKYPYTDFHELNLDWVIERVKKLTEDWLATQQEWNDTEEQWQQLHDYVMNYFVNLDVQDEINHKLDEMVADGTLDAIIIPILNQYESSITGRIETLEARMSEFASLPEGSTAGNAELLDIRIPATGFNNNETYSSAGDAVRGQASELKNSMGPVYDDIFIKSTYTNTATDPAQGATYGFSIPRKTRCLRFSPFYSGVNGQLYAKRYLATSISEGATYTLVEEQEINMGGHFTFYNLTPDEFITVTCSNGYVSNNNAWPSAGLYNARGIYTNNNTLHLLNERYVFAAVFDEWISKNEYSLDRIVGGIHNTNAIMSTNGTQSYVASDKNYRVTKYEIEPGTLYRYICEAKGQGAALICFYDSSDTFLGYEKALTSTVLTAFDVTFNTPATCSYIKCSGYYPNSGVLYTHGEKQEFPYAGKIFVSIGDSRTWYDQEEYTVDTKYPGTICNGYQYYLRKMGAVTFNNGASGFTTPQLNARCRTYTVDTTGDYFIIWSGVNDWQKNVQLGNIEPIGSAFDDTTTAGAYQAMIEYIINNNPNAKIFIMGNYQSWNNNQGTSETPAMTNMIKSICDLYAIPFLDLYNESRFNILNRDTFFADTIASGVYLHLSNYGYEFISNMICNFIKHT